MMHARRMKWIGAGLTVGAAMMMFAAVRSAQGHCDTMDGPVVKDAQAALDKGDISGVLKWVPKEAEDEIHRVFAKTLVVRAKGAEAKELADVYFFETLVRVHRASEGAPYTGVKPAGTPTPAPVLAADGALEHGNVDELAKRIAAEVEAGVRARFAAAAEARKHKDHNAEAGRKYVASYVEFVHYVERMHEAAAGHGAHHAAEAGSGAEHAHHEKAAEPSQHEKPAEPAAAPGHHEH